MATSKKGSKKGSTKGTTKAATRPTSGAVALQDATKAIQDAVKRAAAEKQLPAKLRGPIYVGIWYNPVTKKIEVVNQLEQF